MNKQEVNALREMEDKKKNCFKFKKRRKGGKRLSNKYVRQATMIEHIVK